LRSGYNSFGFKRRWHAGRIGPLSTPDCEKEYITALRYTMNIFKMGASTQFLDEKKEDQILSCMHVQCALKKLKAKFMETDHYKPKENAKSWPLWSSKNCTLRKIILCKYKSNSLPIPFVNAIRKIPNNAFRSFFTQRCIAYHNALC
jgi:hypothetical protein